MPLGTVTQVSPGPELFLNVRVKPAAHISKLEEVLVITKVIDSVPAVTESSAAGPVRAADILAQRLPTVTIQAPDAETSKKETNIPLSMAEWIRRQKQQQQQQKQGTTTSPSAAAPKNPAAGPASPPATNPLVPKQVPVTGQSGSAQTTTPSSSTAAPAPKKAGPKKQPDATTPPASTPGQPPATPPGVTL
jgi:rod shape-determining protein MreC